MELSVRKASWRYEQWKQLAMAGSSWAMPAAFATQDANCAAKLAERNQGEHDGQFLHAAQVFGNLSLQDVVHASAVCKSWRNVAASNVLWQRTCRGRWRVWENLPDFEGTSVSPQQAGVQWRRFCQWRVESERSTRQLVASMMWPLKLPGCLRTLVSLGNLVVEELERLEARPGDLEEGTRFFASLALETIHRSACLNSIRTLVATPELQLEDQLATGALLIAKLRYQDLDIDAINSRLDDIATLLRRRLDQDAEVERHGGINTPGGALAGLKLLNALLFRQPADTITAQEHNGADDTEHECLNLSGVRETFYPPERLYLNELLDSRKGVDLSLGILHSAIGRRCGIPVCMVAMPMLFMTKVGNEGEPEERFVNLFTGGVLQRSECMDLILMMGVPYDSTMLAPVPPTSLLVALCDNLIAMYRQGTDAGGRQVAKWQKQTILPLLDVVLLINPDDCSHRFSRAKVLLEMTDFEAAVKDLQELLQRADDRGGGGDGQEGIPSALLHQFLQRAIERRDIHAAWCSKQRLPRPAHVKFRIGQTIKHRRLLYTGVIFGWDTECSADEEWILTMKVDQLQFGRSQPFYRVLPDQKNRSTGVSDDLNPTATYVPQENIFAAPDAGPMVHEELGMHFRGYRNGKYIPNEYLCHIYPDDAQQPDNSEGNVREQPRSDDVAHEKAGQKAISFDVLHGDRPDISGSSAHSAYKAKAHTDDGIVDSESGDGRCLHVSEEDARHAHSSTTSVLNEEWPRDRYAEFAAGREVPGVQTVTALQLVSEINADTGGSSGIAFTVRKKEQMQDKVDPSWPGDQDRS